MEETRVAMAAGAHPDDIEFMMSGTLLKLADAGWKIHYMNICNGNCGSMVLDHNACIEARTKEAMRAAEFAGAAFHSPLVNDLELLYDLAVVRKLCAIVREVRPQILLLPSPQDYMEDHMNASRTMVSAAFCRAMQNFVTIPESRAVDFDMAIYHALPHGLMDQLGKPVMPEFFVDVTGVMDRKRTMLEFHESQRGWLDDSQGMDNYVGTMVSQCKRIGGMSGEFEYAEGWRRHNPLGFSADLGFNPLCQILSDSITENASY
ncbi:MAG: PIG-L family deacetylase [Armatimonadota bacterium]|jgi:LmbE family N-acetylglucosaminyl deacetylase